MSIVPKVLKTISISQTNKLKNYYTGYIHKKQHIYTFSNEEAVNECAFFIAQYKSRYGVFPEINESENIPIKPNEIQFLKQKPVLSIIENELVIEDENTSDIIEKCLFANMGLLLIYNFDFKLKGSKIDVNFSASSILPDDIEVNNSYIVDSLNHLFNN